VDLTATIRELRAQRDKLESAIKELETFNGAGPVKPRSPRGRKSMDEAERREVSARMKRYWASRRKVPGSNQQRA
jgi:hypothetical protein